MSGVLQFRSRIHWRGGKFEKLLGIFLTLDSAAGFQAREGMKRRKWIEAKLALAPEPRTRATLLISDNACQVLRR